MRTTQLVTAAITALLAHGAAAKEVAPDPAVAKIYDSGAVHEQLMAKKHAAWNRELKAGHFNSKKWKSRGGDGAIRCKNGVAAVIPGDAMNTFKCNKV